MDSRPVIIVGYGNPGRRDDGLGPALVEMIEAAEIPGVLAVTGFQLNIEDACTIAGGSAVIFVDASIDGEEPFSFYEIEPASEIRFTTHAISPGSVLALCRDLFDESREASMLSIRGYSWEFAEGLSEEARGNLEKAYDFLCEKITEIKTTMELIENAACS